MVDFQNIPSPEDPFKKISSEKLKQIIEGHEKWLYSEEKEGAQAKLHKFDLRGVDLQYAKLQRSDFSWCDLTGANLNRAFLHRANLFYAILDNSNLSAADLYETNFEAAVIRNSRIISSNLHNAELLRTDLSGSDLSECDFVGAEIRNAVFTNCVMNHIRIHKAALVNIPEDIRNKYQETWTIKDRTDVDLSIKRSIEFPPEYKQAGVSILNYFSEVLEKKYPEAKAKVQITQDGRKISMKIDPIVGDPEIIEKTLDEYGLVVTGKMTPEEFTDDPIEIIKLQNHLDIARVQIENQKRLLQYQDDQIKKKDIRIDKFLTFMETALQGDHNINVSIGDKTQIEQVSDSAINVKSNIKDTSLSVNPNSPNDKA